MKKLLAIILAVAMLLCFAGCGSEKTDDKVLKVATNAEFEPFESLTLTATTLVLTLI